MDRNFPGVPRIRAMLEAGTHVLIRVRDGITLRRTGELPARRLLPGRDLRRRHHADRTGDRVSRHRSRADVPELFCLITDLHDHAACPAASAA